LTAVSLKRPTKTAGNRPNNLPVKEIDRATDTAQALRAQLSPAATSGFDDRA